MLPREGMLTTVSLLFVRPTSSILTPQRRHYEWISLRTHSIVALLQGAASLSQIRQ